VPDIPASHLTDGELLGYVEYYMLKHKTLPLSLQKELIQRFRAFVDDIYSST